MWIALILVTSSEKSTFDIEVFQEGTYCDVESVFSYTVCDFASGHIWKSFLYASSYNKVNDRVIMHIAFQNRELDRNLCESFRFPAFPQNDTRPSMFSEGSAVIPAL